MEKEITYIKHDRDVAGLAILSTLGRKYAHIIHIRQGAAGAMERVGWTEQVELKQVTLLDGFRIDIVEQFGKYSEARRKWVNLRNQTYVEARYDECNIASQRVAQRMKVWDKEHPEPQRAAFINIEACA